MNNRIEDRDFVRIIVKENPRARNITMRLTDAGLIATVPVGISHSELMKVIDKHRDALLQKKGKMKPESSIDENFQLNTLGFSVRIFRTERQDFYFTRKEKVLHVACPAATNFESEAVRNLLVKGIERFLKADARNYLPVRLKSLADKHGLSFSEVKINSSKSRWGSCSSRRSINLSFYMMLLPSHLIDYVLLHELTHTLEMNHSPRFWARLDGFCGASSSALRAELKAFRTRI